jgi:ribosomal protein S18 acetylase RimI-like enzyme
MERAERRLSDDECPKINLQLPADNSVAAELYERLGYTIDDVVASKMFTVRFSRCRW